MTNKKEGYTEVESFSEWVDTEGLGLFNQMLEDDDWWDIIGPEKQEFIKRFVDLCERYKRAADANEPKSDLDKKEQDIRLFRTQTDESDRLFKSYFPYGFEWRRVGVSSNSSILTADSSVSLAKVISYVVEADSLYIIGVFTTLEHPGF